MALVVNDRVKETSTTTGTVTFTLDGAVAGFETFSSAIGNSNTTYYAIEIPNSTEFEVGLGTVSAGQLARTTVISSSNSDALVNFSAGTKNVFCTLPASKAVIKDASNNVTLPADLTVDTDTLYVDSSNNRVGIGTTSPDDELHITSGDGNNPPVLRMQAGGGQLFRITCMGNGTDTILKSEYGLNLKSQLDDIHLSTGNTERVTIKTSTGNVGIGTSSPSATLDVDGSAIFNESGAAVDFRVEGDTNANLFFVDGSTDRVGIGGIPTERLTVIGPNNSSAATLKVKDTDGRGILISSPYSGSGVGHIGTDGTSSALGFKVNGTEYARFSTNGYFGIGTTSPQQKFHVEGSTDILQFLNSTDAIAESVIADSGGSIKYGTRDSGEFAIFVGGSANSYFANASSEALRIDSSGNVGIGTTSPSSLLHLSSSDPQITITDTDGTGSPVIKADVNDLVLDSPGNIILDAFSNSLIFKDNGQQIGTFANFSGDFGMQSSIVDQDIIFRGNDNGVVSTVLTLDMSEAGAATFNDKVILGANKVIEFGDAGETISGDGTDLTIASSRHIKFDATNDITLDSGAGGLKFDDDGVTIGLLFNASGDLTFKVVQQDKDLNIKGNDGGSEITALSLDMSEAGAATFNSSVTVGANLDVSSGTIKLDGNYPTGTNNVALGDTAFDSVTTGADNTVIGSGAGTAVTTGQQNTVVGSTALNTGNATGNTAIGFRALRAITGANNVGIGRSAGHDASGGQNTFVGGSAGYYINGTNNVAVGYQAGNGFGTTGSSNIFMGYRAGDNITNGSNNIIIGTSADASSATASNEITLGDANITSLRIPGLQSGASSGDVLTYDGTDITLSAPTGVSAGFAVAMAIAL